MSSIKRFTSASRLSRALSTWSSIPSVCLNGPFRPAACGKEQASGPHYHRVAPTVLLFLERTLSPLSGLNGCPTGSYLYARPPPTRGRWPVGRPRLASPPALRYPAFGRPRLRRSLSLSGRFRLSAARLRCGVAERSPLRSDPRLRFGHPARPPLGHHLFSYLCTVVSFGAVLVVSLCRAAGGFAYAYAFAFAFETASDSCRDWVSGCGPYSYQYGSPGCGWNSCQDWSPESVSKNHYQ